MLKGFLLFSSHSPPVELYPGDTLPTGETTWPPEHLSAASPGTGLECPQGHTWVGEVPSREAPWRRSCCSGRSNKSQAKRGWSARRRGRNKSPGPQHKRPRQLSACSLVPQLWVAHGQILGRCPHHLHTGWERGVGDAGGLQTFLVSCFLGSCPDHPRDPQLSGSDTPLQNKGRVLGCLCEHVQGGLWKGLQTLKQQSVWQLLPGCELQAGPQWPAVWKQMFLREHSQIILALWMMKRVLSVRMLQFWNVCQEGKMSLYFANREWKEEVQINLLYCNQFHEWSQWQMYLAYNKRDQQCYHLS